MLNKLYHNGAEIKSAFLNGVKVFGIEDTGLAKDYSGTGWYKATDTGTVFNKGVPNRETHIFPDDPKEYISVYTEEDAKSYADRAATSNMTDMNYIFAFDSSFNKDISHWDVSNVTSMAEIFSGATSFNQNLSTWDTGKVTDMYGMFSGAISFNQDLSTWNVSNVKYMTEMFSGSSLFNGDISGWNTSKVVDMYSMFSNATSFNQDISSWDTSEVFEMTEMFSGATSFNQDLSGWCVPLIEESPYDFVYGNSNWTLPKPVWGTCPRGENTPD